MEEIPPEFVLNWAKQAFIQCTVYPWMMKQAGSKGVKINGISLSKQLITTVL